MYGFIFMITFVAYGFVPSITIVAIVQLFLRVFEYAINKPTREIIFSSLKKDDRYKSSVFIDTFISRFGDLTGSSIVAIGKLTTVAVVRFKHATNCNGVLGLNWKMLQINIREQNKSQNYKTQQSY